ncbi:uncharacterized protein [Linepithema humile]|uniref:uncharacterized protein isoform X2 n=1 Tax=Linepithema humile TaxID=83485 RepID=UPI00351E8205
MAEEKIDDILVRVDEIEKLQTELRHLVPRVTSNSSRQARHQDLSRDSSTSIRFPSLFTFPVISNFTSSPKNERVQRSAAQLNLSNKLSSGNRSSTATLKNAGRPLTSASLWKGRNIFKDLIKSSNNIANLHEKNSLASTSGINPKASTTPAKNVITSRIAKNSQEIIKKGLKNEMSKTPPKNKMQHVISERSNMRLAKNEKTNSNIGHSNSHGKNGEVRKHMVIPNNKKKSMS